MCLHSHKHEQVSVRTAGVSGRAGSTVEGFFGEVEMLSPWKIFFGRRDKTGEGGGGGRRSCDQIRAMSRGARMAVRDWWVEPPTESPGRAAENRTPQPHQPMMHRHFFNIKHTDRLYKYMHV